MNVGAERHLTDHAAEPALLPRLLPRIFLGLVTGTFLFGWAAGVLVVLKCWRLGRAPQWMMVSGAGYLTFMLIPIVTGFGFTWISSRLVSRGWGGVPLGFLALGLCGLVAGMMVL